MSPLRNIFSKRLFKLALGASALGGLGFATYQFNEYILNQPTGNDGLIKFNKINSKGSNQSTPSLKQSRRLKIIRKAKRKRLKQ